MVTWYYKTNSKNRVTLGQPAPRIGHRINSLAPRKFERNFRYVIFKWSLVTDGWGISCEIAPIWMSLNFTDDQSTLVQVMAWCRQATSHYLSQCWPRSLSPYGFTGPKWVNKKKNRYIYDADHENTLWPKMTNNKLLNMFYSYDWITHL